MRDHFARKTEVETDGLFHREMTLRQRLRHDTLQWCSKDVAEADRPVMGPGYYQDLNDLYSEKQRPEDMLLVDKALPENKRPISDGLLRAVGCCRLEHPNRTVLRDWLAANKTASQQELVLLLKLLCKTRVTANNDSLNLAIVVMRWLVDTNLAEKFKGDMDVMAPFFNMVLCAAGRSTKSKPVPGLTLLRLHAKIVPLVADAAKLKLCLELHDDDLLGQAVGIVECCNASPFAAWLLQDKRRAVLSAQLAADVAEAVRALLGVPVTEASLDRAKAALSQRVKAYWVEPLKRRTVAVAYRGLDVQIKVKSVSEQLEYCFQAAAKQQLQMRQENPLLAFSIENDLCELPERDANISVAEELVCRWQLCRERAQELLAGLKELHAIMAMLKLRTHELERMDPGVQLELQFMACFTKERALVIVQDKVLSILPNEASTATIAECSQQLAELRKSPLVSVGGDEVLNTVVLASNTVGGLLLGRAPLLRRPSKFMTSVLAKCQNFCRATSTSGKAFRGQAAAERLFSLLTAKKVQETPAEQYEWLQVWRHHLPPKEAAELDKLTEQRLGLLAEETNKRKGDSELLEAAVHSAGACGSADDATKPAQPAKAAGKKKTKGSQQSALDLALELL